MAMTRSSSDRTIDEELGLQATRVDLGLQAEPDPIPVGEEQRFLVHRALGQGNMGTVYLAYDQRLEREVALKVVAPHRLELSRLEGRLKREAQALAAFRHENIVQVYDLSSTDLGERFIAMEYVPGKNLRQWQRESKPSTAEIVDAYMLAGRGLAAAHDRGVVHRDFKPDNVLIDEQVQPRRVLVSDFGLAGADPQSDGSQAQPARGLLTSNNGLIGTTAYMAPEQLSRDPAGPRSDQHQFCVALWEALGGGLPFPKEGRSLDPKVALPPRPRGIPRWIHRVLERGLAFERSARYPAMTDLLGALQRGRAWRRARPWVLGLGVLGLAGAASWHALRVDPCQDAGSAFTEVWTDDARRSLDTAIREAGTPYSDDLASFAVGGLDRATREWATQAQQICEATEGAEATPDRDLVANGRDRCIDDAARRIREVVERLEYTSSDPAGFPHIHQLVSSIWSPGDDCQRPAIPISTEVQEQIDRARMLQLEREDTQALQQALAATDGALNLGQPCSARGTDSQGRPYSHELAAALFRLGDIQREQGATVDALENLGEARMHASACADGLREADAWIYIAKIQAVEFQAHDDAEMALRNAGIQLDRVKEPSRTKRRHEEWKAAGLLAAQQGQFEEARAHYQRGLDVLGPAERYPVEGAKLLHDIGITFQGQGRMEDARIAYDRAVELATNALGAEHPYTRKLIAKRELGLALYAVNNDHDDEARKGFAAAIEQGNPSLTAKALTAWIELEHAVDAMKEAERLVRGLLAFVDQHPKLRSRVVANAKSMAGLVLADLGQPSSVALLEQALLQWTSLKDENGQRITRFYLARALHVLHRDVRARSVLEPLVHDPQARQGTLGELVEELLQSIENTDPTPLIPPSTPE